MEQLGHLFSMLSYLNFFVDVSACVVVMFCIIYYLKGNNPFTSQIWDCLPIYTMIIFGLVTGIIRYNTASQISSQTTAMYGLTLEQKELNLVMPMELSCPVVHKFIATMENDPRVYEVYLTHTDQGYNFATKNVTGTYMPLTKMTKQLLIHENQ